MARVVINTGTEKIPFLLSYFIPEPEGGYKEGCHYQAKAWVRDDQHPEWYEKILGKFEYHDGEFLPF